MAEVEESRRRSATPRRQALAIAGGYALVASLWILFSDQVIARLAATPATLSWLQTVKGWGFVAVTALLLYLLLARLLRRQDRLTADLRASERLFRDTFSHAAVGIAHVAPDGHLLRINSRLCTILGYPETRLLGRAFQELTHADDLNADLEQVQRLLDGEADRFSLEKRYLRGDGSTLWAQLTVALMRTADGRPDYFIAVIEPIAERKQAEAELRRSEARYRSLVEHAPDAILVCDGDRITLVNHACLELCGAERPDQLLGKSPYALFHRDDHAALRTHLQQLDERDATPHSERIVRLDSGTVAVEVSAAPFVDGTRRLTHVILHDIGERLRVEQELRRAHNRFAALFTAAPLVIVQLDAGGRVTLWNPAAERLFGWSEAEVLGRPPPYVAEESLPEFRALVARVIAGESTTGIRLHRRHRDGTSLEISLSTAPTRDANGVIDGVMSIIEEVGDRVRAEAEIQALNTTLEQRVAERTASLEAVLRELESFTNTVAHDLKAPLRGIDGYSRLLREEAAERLTGDDRNLLDRVVDNAGQMQRLIDDLLAYARLERRAPHLRAVDLTPTVAAVRQRLQDTIDRCGAEITLTLPPLTVHADADDLAMVLLQLLDNALKFSCAATPPRIEIGGRAEAQRSVLWIKDNGIGFDPRYHDRIFGIFERLERAEDYPGTGIGLALVYKTLERMDGRVWAESAPGEGAVFYVELPGGPNTTP